MKATHITTILILFCFQILSVQTASLDYGDPFNKSDLFAPYPFIHLDCKQPDQNILLVEKRSQTLFVLRAVDSTLYVEKKYVCSTGKVHGDKRVEGDLKTPEGIYFIRGIKTPQELAAIYGAGALVLDYPNGFDKLNKKNGHGIWIHGTDEPERIENSKDTKGCVVLKNSDFIDLESYIKTDQTPVIIVEELLYRNIGYLQSDKTEVVNFLDKWKGSWENKDIQTFMTCYSHDFVFENMNFNAYRAYKNRLFQQYNQIHLNLSNVQVFRKDSGYVINFYQDYETENYRDFGIKQLYIVKKNDTLQIIREIWSESGQ